MKSIACWRVQPSAWIPVSTTSRPARHASYDRMPKRSMSDEYRPISSASRSVYRPQPSANAVEPSIAERGQARQLLRDRDLQVVPGIDSWNASASASYRGRVSGAWRLT